MWWMHSSFIQMRHLNAPCAFWTNLNNRGLVHLQWGGGCPYFLLALLCFLFFQLTYKDNSRPDMSHVSFSYFHTYICTCAPLFLGRGPYGEVKQGAKRLRCEGHSSKSKYVSTEHPSLGLTAKPNTHRRSGHSTPGHASVSLYTHIPLQASAFEHNPTMLMRGGWQELGNDGCW